ncbi:hypothetical protein M3194_08695 [Paenibacillus glycanilyticus]|uniref:hypothetical protein n=1 Tax=Paenibacillus glycanilyticus TaxID=126569 RepID=UPI00203A4448|nr:hypothetical protein [Paenibacillus glycanilyticus]MCM3627442.1 hypothetical protein [Paenibacillus glycanilyticus]
MNHHTPIENALAAIVRALAGVEAAWVLGGSSGLLLRGVPLPAMPNDIDLYVDDDDYDQIYEILKPFATDAKLLSECGNYRSVLSHFIVEGISVELVGGFIVRADGSRYITEVRTLLNPHSESFAVKDAEGVWDVRVVPLAHELWFNLLRRREDRIAMIIDHYMKDETRHEEARRLIEKRNVLTVEARKQMHQRLAYRQAGAVK